MIRMKKQRELEEKARREILQARVMKRGAENQSHNQATESEVGR